MSFFECYFNNVLFDRKETAVCCPFPHQTSNGIEYEETNASAHINIDKGVYHCKACGKSLSEVGFISEILGCDYTVALKIKNMFGDYVEDIDAWSNTRTLTKEGLQYLHSLGITDKVIEELHLKSNDANHIHFPVTLLNYVLDVRTYNPKGNPKVKSKRGAMMGLIVPWDTWQKSHKHRWVIICAGEKDMAVARSHGFNALTITGGELMLPHLLNNFKERKIAICYDNDTSGIQGAHKLAAALFDIASDVRVVTTFHDVCKKKGEDITDFFVKYNKTAADLKECINLQPSFSSEDLQIEKEKEAPLVTLTEATAGQQQGKLLRSDIQIIGTYEDTFSMPTNIIAKKTNMSDNLQNNQMTLGKTKEWVLSKDTCKDVLKLIDNNFTERQIAENIRGILHIPLKEHYISIQKPSTTAVYKSTVTDTFEMNTKEYTPLEFTAYSVGTKLESGKKYRATYKLIPHPYKGQALIMIIIHTEAAADSVSNFKLTAEKEKHLDMFINLKEDLPTKIETLTNMLKSFIGYDGYNQLIQAVDFSYHTVLNFHFKSVLVRGYLDTLIVAESRVGKSTTALALQELYQLGSFVSLAGSSATRAGLIGGSNTVRGSYQTKAGIIPQNHKNLIIFEELGKCQDDILRELTDIKSSNQVRITRVSGTLMLPALVRMITLTNTKSTGDLKSIASYPNGIEIIRDLVGTPEDIARFDMILVLPHKGTLAIDPHWTPPTPFPKEAYETRIRWVWSRAAEQIQISKHIEDYIIKRANEVNETYDSHIKLFGTETWKKITRLAIAVAGYVVSTDKKYEKIIILKEHVDYAVDYLINLYDNPHFRFKEYVEEEHKLAYVDEEAIQYLQDIYLRNPGLIIALTQTSSIQRQALSAITGLKNDEIGKVVNELLRGFFVTQRQGNLYPTERFRKAILKIKKDKDIKKVVALNEDF